MRLDHPGLVLTCVHCSGYIIEDINIGDFGGLLQVGVVVGLVLGRQTFPVISFKGPLVILGLIGDFNGGQRGLFGVTIGVVVQGGVFVRFNEICVGVGRLYLKDRFYSITNGTVKGSYSTNSGGVTLEDYFVKFGPTIRTRRTRV